MSGILFHVIYVNSNDMKRVAIIGTVGVPARYGGFETLAHHLVDKLSKQFKLFVYCSSKAYSKEEQIKEYKGARLFYLPFNANGIQSIIYDIVSIIHALFIADTLIVLGVSGGIIIPFVRLFTKKRIIVNIDGLEWRRDKWNRAAKEFLHFSEKLAVKWSHADITDNEAIKRYTSINYKTLSCLIEYGADHVMEVMPETSDFEKYPFLKDPYAFKVARIEPENNIHVVLEAFATSGRVLVIVGNWEKSLYGKELKETYSKYPNIHIMDPIYEQRGLDLLRSNCRVYVHGHSAGGTNPSLVEAMYLGLPILSFDVSYNRATTENKAFYFKDSVTLQQQLYSISVADLIKNRSEMKEIASRRYTWEIIAKRYANLIYAFDYKYKKASIHSKFSKLNPNFLMKNGLAHLKNPTKYFE